MKKIIHFFLIVTMILGLVGCSNGENEGAGAGNESITTDVQDSTETENESNNEYATEETEASKKVLIAYFSWSASHNTQTMAEYVADATGGELFAIEPETPYTTNYDDVLDIAQEEQNNNVRPVLAQTLTQEQLDEYDVIFVGYPVWWGDAPMIIYSFMEPLDFSDKTVVTFATSGGSGISDSSLKSAIPANYLDGLCIPNFSAGDDSKSSVNEWVEGLEY